MKISYSVVAEDNALTITSCRAFLPLFGRWSALSITCYSFEDGIIYFNFGMRPSIPSDNLQFSVDGLSDGKLYFRHGANGHQRIIEQDIGFSNLYGQMLEPSELQEGGALAGRTVAAGMMRKFESIVETTRQDIRKSLGKAVFDEAIHCLDSRFGKITEKAIKQFLGEMNWKLFIV